MTDELIERVARAIEEVQIFSRYNDFTSDCVEGLPIEICRYGSDDEDEIVVLKRFGPLIGEQEALRQVIREYRAQAALAALEPGDVLPNGLKLCPHDEGTLMRWQHKDSARQAREQMRETVYARVKQIYGMTGHSRVSLILDTIRTVPLDPDQ